MSDRDRMLEAWDATKTPGWYQRDSEWRWVGPYVKIVDGWVLTRGEGWVEASTTDRWRVARLSSSGFECENDESGAAECPLTVLGAMLAMWKEAPGD